MKVFITFYGHQLKKALKNGLKLISKIFASFQSYTDR